MACSHVTPRIELQPPLDPKVDCLGSPDIASTPPVSHVRYPCARVLYSEISSIMRCGMSYDEGEV